MHITKQENVIRIKPGEKPTHISIKDNHVRVGEKPMEFKIWALSCDGVENHINGKLQTLPGAN